MKADLRQLQRNLDAATFKLGKAKADVREARAKLAEAESQYESITRQILTVMIQIEEGTRDDSK